MADWTIYQKEFELNGEIVVNWLITEYNKIRAGRVSLNTLDGIKVDAYDDLMPINQLANMQIIGARSIVITPFDKSVMKNISDAIVKSNIGVVPNLNDQNIQLNFPQMSEESRKTSVKSAKEIMENAKIKIRNIRQDIQNKYRKEVNVSEDTLRFYEDELNKITKKYNANLENIFKNKEVELLKI